MFQPIDFVSAWLCASWPRLLCLSLTIILLVDVIIKKVIKIKNFREKIDQLPGPPARNIILGNIPTEVFSLFTRNSQHVAEDFYRSQIQSVLGHTFIHKKESLFRLWIGQEPVICIWKPEMVELVLGNNFLLEKSYHYDFLRPWLGNGLLTSPGKIWRPRRKLLVPSFHFNILQAFVPVFDRKSKFLVKSLKLKLNEGISASQECVGIDTRSVGCSCESIVDITPVITACTLDAICETIMGVSINAQTNPNNDYCQSVYIVGETFLERIIQPQYWIDCIFKLTQLGKLYNYHLNKLHSFTRTVIAEKKKEKFDKSTRGSDTDKPSDENQLLSNSLISKLKVLNKTSVDNYQESKKDAPKLPKAFLDLLLDKIDASGEMKLSDEEIREEVDTFMFEGHDTTAMALSWTLFLLGHYQEAQKKLQEEVDRVWAEQMLSADGDIELDQLKNLKYMDCVIKEALRLCPSVPFIGRKTTSDFKLGEYSIPPGCVVFVLIYQLHRNTTTFPDPEKFDPDRFLPKNTLGRHPYAYVPFSAGPRNCIGQKFAMAEMKTILLNLIRNFHFDSVTPLDKARFQMEMVLRPKCPLNIRIKPRKLDIASIGFSNSLGTIPRTFDSKK